MSDLREALTRLVPLIDTMLRSWVFTAEKDGEVVADMNTLRAYISAEPAQEMTDEQKRDLVKECGLDWHRGFVPLFEGDETNRYAVLIDAAIRADRASRLHEITDEQIVSAMLAGSGGDPVWMRLTNKQMIAAGRAVEALVRGKT